MLKKYPHLFLVLFAEGATVMATELMGAKLIAPFYGSSLYVWAAILSITTLGLASGYYIGGQLSAKQNTGRLLLVILCILSLLLLILPHSASRLISLTATLDLIPGISVAGFLLLFPPMLCFGMVGPIVVRRMAENDTAVRNIAGIVYFTSTLGGIVATFLFGYYLIPHMGLRYSAYISSAVLALAMIIYFRAMCFVKRYHAHMPNGAKGSNVKQTKSIKDKTSHRGKVNSFIYLYAVLEGAVVMAVELIAARMIAPYFGASLYVWSAVIGFTLTGLAVGYFLGGMFADKYAGLNALYWILLISSMLLIFMHYTAAQLSVAFANSDVRFAVIVVCFFLVLPPLLLLGMVPTLLIRYITSTIENSGKVTGNVFTISSASGIISLVVVGFYVIPQYGLAMPSIIIGVITGVVPCIKLISQKKYYAVVFLGVIILSLSIRSVEQPKSNIDIQYFSEGLLGQLLVADATDTSNGTALVNRTLFSNRIGQTFVNANTGVSTADYIIYTSSIASILPRHSNALLLGLGGGSVANMLHNGLDFNVDAVELDERMFEISKEYFALNSDVHVVIDDARHYIETTDKKYDLIFFDVFRGDITPAHVFSIECFEKAKSMLSKNGLIVINFFGFLDGKVGKAGRSVYKTLYASGMDVRILPTVGAVDERNLLFIASAAHQNFSNLKLPLFLFNKQVDIDTLFYNAKKIDIKDAVVLTDDCPVLDFLSIDAAFVWRKSALGYTNMFRKSGVPIFR